MTMKQELLILVRDLKGLSSDNIKHAENETGDFKAHLEGRSSAYRLSCIWITEILKKYSKEK